MKVPTPENVPSPASNADVKNAWSCTSILPYIFVVRCLIKHMDNFTSS
jgi:hypothetical protein